MEDKGLTSERAFGAQVSEATLGDDLSNAVVRHGDSLLARAVSAATRPITPPAKRGLCCTYVSLPGGHRVPRCRRRQECSAPRRGRSCGSQRCPRCGRWPSSVDLCVAVGRLGDHGSSSAQCWTTLWFSYATGSNRTAVGPSSSVISEWLTTYSPSSSRLPARATRRDCSRDGPVSMATLIVPAGDSDGIKPRDRRR